MSHNNETNKLYYTTSMGQHRKNQMRSIKFIKIYYVNGGTQEFLKNEKIYILLYQ